MVKISRLSITILLISIIVFGCLIADNKTIAKDSILHPRYVVKCVVKDALVKVGGYVENITLKEKSAFIRGKDGYTLKLIYNDTNLVIGDEIVVLGYYDNSLELFIVKKIYKYSSLMKKRYVSFIFVLPFIALIFFSEYRFKNFKFVKD